MAKDRICIVDRTSYKYCGNCSDYNPNEKWRYAYCSENCRDIYGVCEDFANKKIDEFEAQDRLSKLDISKKDKFLLPLQNNIADIFSVEKPVFVPKKKAKNKVEEPVVAEVVDEPVQIESDIVNEDLI